MDAPVARRLGVNETTWHNWERRPPPSSAAHSLGEAPIRNWDLCAPEAPASD